MNSTFPVGLEVGMFNGGERRILVSFPTSPLPTITTVDILCKITSSDGLIDLLLIVDALHRHETTKEAKLNLLIPYLPYARQDRVCFEGEAHSLKVVCSLLNTLQCATITVADPHSFVIEGLLDKLKVIKQNSFAIKTHQAILADGYVCDLIISPDAGAEKKALLWGKEVNLPVVTASKQRNSSGEVVSTEIHLPLHETLEGKTCLIVDDICDGGATFIKLAERLKEKGAKEVLLFITHGIFSKGVEFDNISSIYTTDSFNTPLGVNVIYNFFGE